MDVDNYIMTPGWKAESIQLLNRKDKSTCVHLTAVIFGTLVDGDVSMAGVVAER